MKTELLASPIPHELPAAEVRVQITQCQNRFEILVKPGQEITSWDSWVMQGRLAQWLQSRIDAQKSGGHNPPNSFP
jgi:hypothetical protein